ncbi:hypothetical protein [Phenylobacterium sp.]|uniref:hypothetical protein n=1 Tax=Phenylobacterium sp. TaxID=1871053 RepID=UPI002CF94B05|nr:hypothetical protein [Phenylobacterium sp.]HVI33814.1 hypothetical protein [Phenylobacterium sp.]
MSSDWIVEVCCRDCGRPVEAPLHALPEVTALPCPHPDCTGQAALPTDLAETARFLFEESHRRLRAEAPPPAC